MEKHKIEVGNKKEYLEYCKQVHKKDRFTKIHKSMFSDPETKYGGCGWMNGGILYYGGFKNVPDAVYPTAIETTVGNGNMTNVYRITMHKKSHGVGIVKTLMNGAEHTKSKYFVCGNEPEPVFGDFKKEHETIDIDEIIYLANKNWLTFKNVNIKNKYNVMFLEEFKKIFIKRLLYCDIVCYSNVLKKYIETY